MKTITTTVYSFNELSEDAKQKAIESNYYINVGHEWFDYIIDEFKHNEKDFNVDKVYSSGFHSQGDGAMFEYDGISDDLKDEFIDNLNLSPMRTNWLKNNTSVSAKGNQSGHYYHEKSCSHSIYWEIDNGDLHRSTNFYKWLERWLESFADMFENFVISRYEDKCIELYSKLSHSYDYLTSDEEIEDTIIANDLEFYEDGSRY